MIHVLQAVDSGPAALDDPFPDQETSMDHVEVRLRRLERERTMVRLLGLPFLCVLPLVFLLAGAGTDQGNMKRDKNEAIIDKLVARSLVLVDESNRPRINLGIDSSIGAHMFLRGEDGSPMLALAAYNSSGSIAVLDREGHAIAFLTASGSGQGLLRLADAAGRTIARLGQWSGQQEPGVEFYTASDQSIQTDPTDVKP